MALENSLSFSLEVTTPNLAVAVCGVHFFLDESNPFAVALKLRNKKVPILKLAQSMKKKPLYARYART